MNKWLKNVVNKKRALPVSSLLLVFLAFGCAEIVLAESYDIYVDKSYSGDEDGSIDKPYSSISDAIEKGSGKKIFIKKGEYDGGVTLKEGMSLFGEDKSKTIIRHPGNVIGTYGVTAKGGNILKNLTVSGGYLSIIAEGKITISDCKIKNGGKIGIQLSSNDDLATIEKTDIFDNKKGIYVEKGRNISITSNNIYNNKEEGLDIRDRVKGTVSGNNISSNGEGGVEVIIVSSKINFKNNTIKKNKACGIAGQFYEMTIRKDGKIEIVDNTISQNGKNGICCNSPSGGDVPKGYWNNSVSLSGNKIEDNKLSAIAKSCKLIEAVDEEVEKQNTIIGDTGAEEENKNSNKEENIEGEILIDRQNELKQIFLDKSSAVDASLAIVSQKKEEIEKINKMKVFFVGYNPEITDMIEKENENLKRQREAVSQILSEAESDQVRTDAEVLINKIDPEIKLNDSYINEKSKKFSLFGWIFKYYYSTKS